tara:strand:- start:2337 stop:3167 length:831 start_codon:yes stop_codon:yes gene_type:complete
MTVTFKKIAAFKVRPVNNGTKKSDRNRYCGPAVLSIMSGITTGDASRLIRSIFTQVHAVKGTSDHQIKTAFKHLGIDMSRVSYRGAGLTASDSPTLARWLRDTTSDRTAGRVFLVSAGWHWQIITGRRYICGIVKELISIRDKRVKRRARVRDVYELTPIAADGKIRIPLIEQPKSRKAPDCYRRVRKLIQENADIELKYCIEHFGFGNDTVKWVEVCGSVDDFIDQAGDDINHLAHEDADEVNDGRACYSWDEVEYMMLKIISFVDKYNLRREAA